MVHIKFLKIQDKMEETKSVLIGIETPTADVLIFLNDVLKVGTPVVA